MALCSGPSVTAYGSSDPGKHKKLILFLISVQGVCGLWMPEWTLATTACGVRLCETTANLTTTGARECVRCDGGDVTVFIPVVHFISPTPQEKLDVLTRNVDTMHR
jgi:hypothetical protein